MTTNFYFGSYLSWSASTGGDGAIPPLLQEYSSWWLPSCVSFSLSSSLY